MAKIRDAGDGRVDGRIARVRRAERVLPLGVFLLALALGLMFPRAGVDSYDTDIMLQVAESMVKEGSFEVHRDMFGFNTPYASYALGMPALMAVAYATAQRLGSDPVSAAMDVNAFIFAGFVVPGSGSPASLISHHGDPWR